MKKYDIRGALPLLIEEARRPPGILSSLGSGGRRGVYLARDPRIDRRVAIKVLPGDIVDDADSRKRFEREARAVGGLNHPHICTLYDIGREDTSGGPIDFLVMRYAPQPRHALHRLLPTLEKPDLIY